MKLVGFLYFLCLALLVGGAAWCFTYFWNHKKSVYGILNLISFIVFVALFAFCL